MKTGPYYLLNLESPGESMDSVSAIGPFADKAEAREWVRQDAAALVGQLDEPLAAVDFQNWSEGFVLVKSIEHLKPVPEVTVNVGLEGAGVEL